MKVNFLSTVKHTGEQVQTNALEIAARQVTQHDAVRARAPAVHCPALSSALRPMLLEQTGAKELAGPTKPSSSGRFAMHILDLNEKQTGTSRVGRDARSPPDTDPSDVHANPTGCGFNDDYSEETWAEIRAHDRLRQRVPPRPDPALTPEPSSHPTWVFSPEAGFRLLCSTDTDPTRAPYIIAGIYTSASTATPTRSTSFSGGFSENLLPSFQTHRCCCKVT